MIRMSAAFVRKFGVCNCTRTDASLQNTVTKLFGTAGLCLRCGKPLSPPRQKRPPSKLEEALAAQIKAAGLPEPVREHRFCERRWRLDFFWLRNPAVGPLAVEVEGGNWTRGRHTRGQGFEDDCAKYNRAALMGITVLRFTARTIKSGEALRLIKEALYV